MRQTKIVSMIDDGREVIFKIKQMPATKAERFTNRVLALLAGSAAGIDVKGLQRQLKSEKQEGGLQEIANLLTKLNYEKVEPLYNELIECVEHVPDSNNHNFTVPCTQESIDSIISDFRNLYKLRFEVLKLNYGFLTNAPSVPSQKAVDITIPKPIRM
jgi:hypothetical protein